MMSSAEILVWAGISSAFIPLDKRSSSDVSTGNDLVVPMEDQGGFWLLTPARSVASEFATLFPHATRGQIEREDVRRHLRLAAIWMGWPCTPH
jgi:hypothetical protein